MRIRQGDRHDHRVLAVRGILSPETDVAVRQELRTLLLDHGRVVVDLSEATVASGAARHFPAALAQAGGWPLARLVLARADRFTATILQASRVHLTAPLASTLAEARVVLDARPPRVVRDHELPGGPTAPQLARAALASACEDWEFDDGLYEAAATVATELVGNAIEHAGTACVLHLALDRARLRVAVRDDSPVTRGCPQIAVAGERGYGLLIVEGLTRAWGVIPHTRGKTVWAALDARGSDAPVRCLLE